MMPPHSYFDCDHVDLTATVFCHGRLLLFSVGKFCSNGGGICD